MRNISGCHQNSKCMKRIFFIVLALALPFSACQTRDEASELQVINLGMDEIPDLNDLSIKATDIVEFKSPPEVALRFVWKIIKTENEYVLIDKHPDGGRVLRYNLAGNFLNIIGKVGRGPGEYIDALDVEFNASDGYIYVLSKAGKILKYDLSGVFSREYSSKYYTSSFGINQTGNFYQYASFEDTVNRHGIFEFDKKENQYKLVYQKQTAWYPIEELNFHGYDGRVFFREAFSNTIFEIKEEGLTPLFFFDWQDKNYKNEYDNLDLVSVFEKMAIQGAFFSFRSMAINDHLVYACFGDELSQLTYHVYHFYEEGKTRAFYTKNEDGFFIAMVLNDSNHPGFILDGINLKVLADKDPSLFEGLNDIYFTEDSTYLVFFDIAGIENH